MKFPAKLPVKHVSREAENVDNWLMSYADMITLLLGFFVIFVATSEPKPEKLAAATRGMQEKFGVINFESPYDDVYRNVAGVIVGTQSEARMAIDTTERGFSVEVSSGAFFTPGSAELLPEGKAAIAELIKSLSATPLVNAVVMVEGHSSDAPLPEDSPYKNHFALAAARAQVVLDMLKDSGIPEARLRLSSLGATQPAVPNADANGKPIPANQQRNERVVIKVERER